MPTFEDILSAPSLFKNRNVLSPHFVPEVLPFREKEIEKTMVAVAPALGGERPRNLFIYGKTGTGKTCTVRKVMKELEKRKSDAKTCYVNCRMYNSRYRVIQKIVKEFMPELDKTGFGLAVFYEKLIEYIQKKGEGERRVIVVLDEVDMVRDLDELIYTLTRINDEISSGSVSIVGITNRLTFKDVLDPRSKSSLCETEMVFAPYTPMQLRAILEQRVKDGFQENTVDESAINLAAAIAAQETGDARYALKLLLKAGEYADERKTEKITDKEVEEGRRNVDIDLATETIATLPIHQQLVLLAVCNLTIRGNSYQRLTGAGENGEKHLMSGEVYEEYSKVCRHHRKPKRSARWYREYLNDLEMLGLITTIESGRGMRGHTRLIKPGYEPEQMKKIIVSQIGTKAGGSEEGQSTLADGIKKG
ncbi:MAG: AAA family ATPase [Candidatus Micrarchaeota archaeon]